MQQLPELLTAVTEELVQIRDEGHAAGALDSTRLERTQDKDFIYLEAELACVSTTEIDISVHKARAFIRIARGLTAPHSGDDLELDANAIFGWVEFAESGATFRAALYMAGIWACAALPEVALLLNDEYSPAGDLAHLASWCDVLIKAADRLNGLAWLVPDTISDR